MSALPCRLVVPCYNEAERLDLGAFAAFQDAHPHIHFLFVDDGSTDGTPDLLRAAVAERPDGFALLSLTPNRGKGEAVRRGLRRALEGPEEVVGFWDADLATPLDTIPEFLAVLAGRPDVQMVLGARVKLLGRDVDRRYVRHVFGRVAAAAASGILGLPVYDTQCGAKLFRRTHALRTTLDDPFLTRWAFDVELLQRWRLAHAHLSAREVERFVVEIPLTRWRDVEGSKVGVLDMAEAPISLARIWWDGRRRR